MRNILTKYYNLDSETMEILPLLYMYNEFLTSIGEYENVKINSFDDEEILMNTIAKCWYSMNMNPKDIVSRLLSVLNFQNITINDLEKLDIESLKKILEYKDYARKKDKSNIIDEFEHRGFYCVLCKNQDEFLLILNRKEDSDYLIYSSLKEVFCSIIDKYILHKYLRKGEFEDDL